MITKVIKNIVNVLENCNESWVNYILTFFFATVLWAFFWTFLQPVNNLNPPTDLLLMTLLHYALAYLMLALMFIGFLSYGCKVPIGRVSRTIFPGFIILLVGPLIDLLHPSGQHASIYYLQPNNNNNVLNIYLSLFGVGFDGVSFGVKIEIILALFLGFIYCRIKNQSVIRSLVYIWICYTLIFLWATSPYFIHFILQFNHFDYQYSDLLMTHFYLLAIPVIAIPVLYTADKNIFNVLLKDCRFSRVLHYELMLILGYILALISNHSPISAQLLQQQEIVIHLIISLMSVFFACFFSISMNNIVDIDIDKISNPERPLIKDKDKISLNHYKIFAYASLGLSLFYAAIVSFYAFFIIMVMTASYYIYSMPPLRFKRILIFSKLTISLNSIALMLLGYFLVNGSIDHFPKGLFWIIFVGYTLAENFIDIKDIEGDKAAGIKTLPTVLNIKHAKVLIGLSFWATYISFIYLYQSLYFLLLLFVTGGVQFYLINKKTYREWQILALYNTSIITLITILIASH